MARKTPIERYRNIGISAHIDAGKTTTTERILFYTPASTTKLVKSMMAPPPWIGWSRSRSVALRSPRLLPPASGRVWPATTPSIASTSLIRPGHVDFTIEVERSMRVLDGACMVYCAVGGVQPQSETVWRQANKYKVPRLGICEQDGPNWRKLSSRSYDQMRARLKANPVPLQVPIGAEENFKGLVDSDQDEGHHLG